MGLCLEKLGKQVDKAIKNETRETMLQFLSEKRIKLDQNKIIDKKVKPYTKTWERNANQLARSFCPVVIPCKECNNPVIDGYYCNFCGSINP